MADPLSEGLAIAAFLGAAVAVGFAWVEWGRLRAARGEIVELEEELRIGLDKVERLGGLVASLQSTVETQVQRLQLSALERQVEVATTALKAQESPISVPRIRMGRVADPGSSLGRPRGNGTARSRSAPEASADPSSGPSGSPGGGLLSWARRVLGR